MYVVAHKLHLVGSALAVGMSGKSLICIDNFYNVQSYRIDERLIEKSLTLTKAAEALHPFSKAATVSRESAQMAMGVSKSAVGAVLSAAGKQIAPIARLTWQKLEVCNVVFSPENTYLATGGEDGRVLLYSTKDFKLIQSLPPFPDYVSCIAFSDDEGLLFISCFGKISIILDLDTNRTLAEFETKSVVNDAMFFDNNTKALYVTQDGDITVFDIDKKTFSRNTFPQTWFTVCEKINENFGVVGAKDNFLRIVRLSDGALVCAEDTQYNAGISSFYRDKFEEKEMLIVGFSDGNIQVIDLNEGTDKLNAVLEKNDLIGAYKLISETNVFLQTGELYNKKIDELWKEKLGEAIDLLAKDKFNEATDKVRPFMFDKKKKEEFDSYWHQKEFVAKFMDAIEAKNYIEAYALAEQNPQITETMVYENLEKYWNSCFQTAQKLLADDPEGHMRKAQETLRAFVTVPQKKVMIDSLMRNVDKYLLAEKEYKAKNFVEYFKLCDRFSFLKMTELYKRAMLVGDQVIRTISVLENQSNYDKALEICKLLESMPPFKEAAKEHKELLKQKKAFIALCQERKLTAAFDAVDANQELRMLPEYNELVLEFKAKAKRAMEFAMHGDGHGMLECIREYTYINFWKEKIASMLKIAYLAEFVNNSPKKENSNPEIDWRETFEYYIERYGKDEELKKVAAEMGLEATLNSISKKGNEKGYLTAIVADSLLSIGGEGPEEFKGESS